MNPQIFEYPNNTVTFSYPLALGRSSNKEYEGTFSIQSFLWTIDFSLFIGKDDNLRIGFKTKDFTNFDTLTLDISCEECKVSVRQTISLKCTNANSDSSQISELNILDFYNKNIVVRPFRYIKEFGSFTLKVDVQFTSTSVNFDNTNSMFSAVKKISENDGWADATVIVCEKSFPVHKCILAANSEFFAAAFFGCGEMLEQGNGKREIILRSEIVNPINFQQLLNYIYTKDIGILQKSTQLAIDLFILSDEFLMDELLKLSYQILIFKNKTDFTIKQALNLYKFCYLKSQSTLPHKNGNCHNFSELKKLVIASLKCHKKEEYDKTKDLKKFFEDDLYVEFAKSFLSTDY